MDKKTETAINEFFAKRRFLTEEEFQEKMKPDDCMTYKEIKEKIYKPEIVPKKFFTEISQTSLRFILNSKNIKRVMHALAYSSLEHFESAANNCKFALTYAIQNSHIQAGNYEAALFIKFQNLQNALVWWLGMKDKFTLFLAHSTNVETRVEIKSGEVKDKTTKFLLDGINKQTINSLYAKEFKSLFTELNDYWEKYGKDKNYNWDGESYSLADIGNDSKHNEDVLTKVLNEILSGTLDYSKFENVFYQQLTRGLLMARNEYIEIANRFMELFEKYVKNCIGKEMYSFTQN